MKFLLPLLLLGPAPAPAEDPQTYLVSIVGLPLEKDESIESFTFDTWGVQFVAVCHIPSGWRITAGSSATPDGTLAGGGSHGATWFSQPSPKELRNLVLVKLSGPMQREDIRDGDAIISATFKGSALISAEEGEPTRPLDYRNIALAPAAHCPAG